MSNNAINKLQNNNGSPNMINTGNANNTVGRQSEGSGSLGNTRRLSLYNKYGSH